MSLSLKFRNTKYSDERLNKSIYEILDQSQLLSMSTVTPDAMAHINTAFYAFDASLHLFIITDPKTIHGTNLRDNDSIAVTVFDSHQPFWTPLRGLRGFSG